MTAPQPGNAPDPDLVAARAWAQPAELPVDAQDLHAYDTWCSILGLASDILWAASGRKWRNVQGTETVTLDSPACGCRDESWLWIGTSSLTGFGWSLRNYGTSRPERVRLPRPDVTAITAVTLAGVPFSAYRLDGNWAVRTDGMGWPVNNGTVITYTFGRDRPEGGRLAAILLATELGKALAGKPCQLPARVTSVTRQGVSFDVLESLAVLEKGLTGVPAVDAWISAENPRKITQRSAVWSPDLITGRPV